MFSINDSVTRYVDELLNREDELNIRSYYLENQSTVIDCGVNSSGSISAGLLFATISMGGLGKVSIVPGVIDDYYLNFAQVCIDNPAIACLGSQKPAWKLKLEGFSGTGYGPARAISQKPKAIYQSIGYSDDSEVAVINIESGSLPTSREMDYIAKQCSTDPEYVIALVAGQNSVAGSIMNSTRAIEWAMNRLFQMGHNISDITSASSVTPIAPIKVDEQEFIGASFDSIAFYGMVHMYTANRDDKFKEAVYSSSKVYNKSFKTLLKESSGDFSKIDPTAFAPARLIVNGVKDGSIEGYGKLDPAMLLSSYGLKKG